jgi:predicted DNA-binding protein YlxM (UPF0122 family)
MYTEKFIKKVVDEYLLCKLSIREISDKYNVRYPTVHAWVTKQRKISAIKTLLNPIKEMQIQSAILLLKKEGYKVMQKVEFFEEV